MKPLAQLLQEEPFQGYAYAYPHKLAYRPLHRARHLAEVWREEQREAMFLYAHIPFCEMRCGFCNLFTTTGTPDEAIAHYLVALTRQMRVVKESLGTAPVARAAIGGGTPTILSARHLDRLLSACREHFGAFAPGMPFSCETSPGTVDAEKLRVLRDHGVTRMSIGVQSFLETETRALGRPQSPPELLAALELLQAARFPILNLDLIYGIPGQNPHTWAESLRTALTFAPGEVYLYPLYVRPLTGLDRRHRAPEDNRLELYRLGRELLLAAGYRQISMRLFRHAGVNAEESEGPVYCCQEDGMIGLGAGARSYTRALHYSTEYAVGRSVVKHIIEDFTERSDEDFAETTYGCELTLAEQKRRHVIKSLLRFPGLESALYQQSFGGDFWNDFPALQELVEFGLAQWNERSEVLTLTADGLERSDTIGPWLFSAEMQERMLACELA